MSDLELHAEHETCPYHLASGGHYSGTPRLIARPTSPPEVDAFITGSMDQLDDALRDTSKNHHRRLPMVVAQMLAQVDPRASTAIARCCLPICINAALTNGQPAIEASRVPCGRRECPTCSFHVGDDNVRVFRERFLQAFDQGWIVEALIVTTGEVGITDPTVAKSQLATMINLLQGLFHKRHESSEFGLVMAMEPAIDQDGLFRPHVHVLAFGMQGVAKRLAQDWNQLVLPAPESPPFVGEARVCEGEFDREQIKSDLRAWRVPGRLSYHLKLRRLKSFRDASPAALESLVRSVPAFKGVQMIRAIGGFRKSGVGRGNHTSGSTNSGLPRTSSRRPQPTDMNPQLCKPAPQTQNPAQPGTSASYIGISHRSGAQLEPVMLSPILSVLLKRWYSAPLDLEPNSDPRVLRRIPHYVGLLPNLVLHSKLATDWHVALAAAVFMRAAARLISNTGFTTSAGPYTENLLKDEIRMLRLAGFDPSLPPEFPFDDFESTNTVNDAAENGFAADNVG